MRGMKIENTSNGVIVRGRDGRFISGTKPKNIISTPQNAREMQAKGATARRISAMSASQQRVMREAQSIDPTVTTWEDALALATAKQYTALLDSDKPRGDDLIRIAQMVGGVPLPHEAREEAVGAIVSDIAQAVSLIAQAMRGLPALADGDIIDADMEDMVTEEEDEQRYK